MRRLPQKADAVIVAAAMLNAYWAIAAYRLVRSLGDSLLLLLLVILPGACALALLVGLLANREKRSKIALLAGTSLVSLMMANAVLGGARRLRRAPAPSPVITATVTPNDSTDRRSRRDVVISLRTAGTEAYVTIPAEVLRGEPFSGTGERFSLWVAGRRVVPLANIAARVLVYCNESGEYTMVHSDERGFNNPQGLWSGNLELAAIGDSFVQGACVDPSETITAHLRSRIAASAAVGIDGNGPLSMLASLEEYVAAARPPIVLWFYFEGNDLGNLADEARDPVIYSYLEGNRQGLLQLQNTIDHSLMAFVNDNLEHERGQGRLRASAPPDTASNVGLRALRTTLHLDHLRAIAGVANLEQRTAHCCRLDLLERVLAHARKRVASWGGTLHFVYLPSVERYHGFPISHLRSDELRSRNRVLDIVQWLQLPLVDVHETFVRSGNPRAFFTSSKSHYNPAGYRTAADAVLKHLLEEQR